MLARLTMLVVALALFAAPVANAWTAAPDSVSWSD